MNDRTCKWPRIQEPSLLCWRVIRGCVDNWCARGRKRKEGGKHIAKEKGGTSNCCNADQFFWVGREVFFGKLRGKEPEFKCQKTRVYTGGEKRICPVKKGSDLRYPGTRLFQKGGVWKRGGRRMGKVYSLFASDSSGSTRGVGECSRAQGGK